MQEDIDMYFEMATEAMQKAVDHLDRELTKVRTGKAHPNVFDGLKVEYYGSPTPVSQVANISAPDGRTLVLQPWEKNMLGTIERAIINANMGFAPQNNGEIIRISIPMLTEERRKELYKQAKAFGEDAKVGVRSSRRDLIDAIKKAVKDGYPEDAGKRQEENAQDLTNKFGEIIEKHLEAKEKDIMTI